MKIIKVFKKGESYINVNVNVAGLEKLEETLNKRYSAHVGILGSSSSRQKISRSEGGSAKPIKDTQAPLSNADIGWVHEFGSYTKNIPERSFLRAPLRLYLYDSILEVTPRINQAILDSNVTKVYSLLGAAAEKVIQDAFRTGGFGHWQKLSPATIARKGSSAILIDSAQLRKSITSKVVVG